MTNPVFKLDIPYMPKLLVGVGAFIKLLHLLSCYMTIDKHLSRYVNKQNNKHM